MIKTVHQPTLDQKFVISSVEVFFFLEPEEDDDEEDTTLVFFFKETEEAISFPLFVFESPVAAFGVRLFGGMLLVTAIYFSLEANTRQRKKVCTVGNNKLKLLSCRTKFYRVHSAIKLLKYRMVIIEKLML